MILILSISRILEEHSNILSPWEIAQIASLLPATSEEAAELIPSLASKEKLFENDLLQGLLDQVLVVCFSKFLPLWS